MLAIAAAVCGYISVTQSFAYVVRHRDPARAYAMSPGDGRITAQIAQDIAGAVDATPADRRRADDLARLALRQDPTAVAAAATLGLDRQIGGDAQGARRFFGYAQTLSRRNLQTQIWAIEDAVARGDIARALTHYDIALRTSREAPDMLYPILAAATSDPAIRAGVVEKLARAPSWGANFISFAAAGSADPRSTAQLFRALRRSGVEVPADARASVIDALIVAGYNDEAWTYYASIRPGSDRRRSRDPRFMANLDTPSVLDWMPVNDGAAAASIQRGDKSGVVDFTAPRSSGGPLIRQLQMLPAGDYQLAGRSSGVDQPASSRPYWVLNCRNDGRELGRADVSSPASAGARFGGGFSVPANCPVQILTLRARPSDALLGLSGQIEQVQLTPSAKPGSELK